MKKVTLDDIKNHFSYCIDEGLTIGEYEEVLLESLYKKAAKVERYEKALKRIAEEPYGEDEWSGIAVRYEVIAESALKDIENNEV